MSYKLFNDRFRRAPGFLLLLGALVFCAVVAALGIPGSRHVTVALTIRTDKNGYAQVFYATGKMPFTEQQSVRVHVSAGLASERILDIPVEWSDDIRFRLDPIDRRKAHVEVSCVRFEFSRGLRTVVLADPGSSLEPWKGLTHVRRRGNTISARSVTEDPVFVVDSGEMVRSSHLRPIVFVLIVFLGLAVLLVLDRPRIADEASAAKHLVYGVALAWIALQTFYYATRIPPGVPPDELAHASYLVHLKTEHRLFPDRPNSRLYDKEGYRTTAVNYLAHPPFYYALFTPFVPNDARAIMRHMDDLRLMNAALALAGVAIFLFIGARQELPLVFHLYYAVALSSVPMLPYLAGSMNNDNLVILGGALTAYGAMRFMGDRPDQNAFIWIGIGAMAGLAAKATAGLNILLFLLLVVAWRVRTDRSARSLLCPQAAVCVILCALPLAEYAGLLWRYGSVIPHHGPPGVDMEKVRVPVMTPLVYTGHFFMMLNTSWTGIVSHASVVKRTFAESLPYIAPLILALAGLFWREKTGPENGEARRFFTFLRLAAVSILLLMVVHEVGMYSRHLRSGYPGGIQARYYFALMPCVLMLSWRPFMKYANRPACLVVMAALMAGFLWSGLFYYMLVRP